MRLNFFWFTERTGTVMFYAKIIAGAGDGVNGLLADRYLLPRLVGEGRCCADIY